MLMREEVKQIKKIMNFWEYQEKKIITFINFEIINTQFFMFFSFSDSVS